MRLTERDGRRRLIENVDDWSLDLEDLRWSRLTDRRWQEWSIERRDGRPNDLFSIQSARWHADGRTAFDRKQLQAFVEAHGALPDFEAFDARYSPPIEHTREPHEAFAHPMVIRNVIDGVTVRYVEDTDVRIVVEGVLPPETIEIVVEDARRKLDALEGVEHVSLRVG